jgi:Ca2+-binding RTX toxin-like protein
MTTFRGSAGNDTIVPGNVSAGVTISGGSGFAGDDFIDGNAGNDVLDGGPGDDFVDGEGGADTVRGGPGADRLQAGFDSSADTVRGGGGDDDIEQLRAGDDAAGGPGDDSFNVDTAGVARIVGNGGIDTLFADSRDISVTTLAGIENLANNATLTGAQLVGFDAVGTNTPTSRTTYTYTFTDTSTVADFDGRVADPRDSFSLLGVNGAANSDRINFDPDADNDVFIRGYEGNDGLNGGAGRDDLRGDEGADILNGRGGADDLYAGSPFSSSDGADILNGGAGADRIFRVGFDDRVDGGAGDDYVDIDEDNPAVLDGGGGIDRLNVDGRDISAATIRNFEDLLDNATLTGAQLVGFDRVGVADFDSSHTYTFTDTTVAADFTGKIADEEDNFFLRGVNNVTRDDTIVFDPLSTAFVELRGYEGDDVLRAGAGDDNLFGDEGSDRLFGNGGSDELSGGSAFRAGADRLFGGDGDDFLYELGAGDRAEGGANNDYFDIDDDGVALLDGGPGRDVLNADGRDLSATTIRDVEILLDNATLTGAQVSSFFQVGASTPGSDTTYTYTFTDTSTPASFQGKIADRNDVYSLRGINNVANNDDIDFSGALAAADIDGYEGDDTLRGGGKDDDIAGAEGSDLLVGNNGNDTLRAGRANDTDDGADVLRGLNGADTLLQIGDGDRAEGGFGDDFVDLDEAGFVALLGGPGTDLLRTDGLALSNAVVEGFEALWDGTELLTGQFSQFDFVGTSTPNSSRTYTYDFANAVSTVDFTGKIVDDRDGFVVNGSSTSANDDVFIFDPDSTAFVTLNGNGGDDVLRAGAGRDIINGGTGSDLMEGGAGTDVIDGGGGNDTASYFGASAGVTVDLRIDDYQDTGGAGFDLLTNLRNLQGSRNGDDLTGNAGRNTLDGLGGADVLDGFVGDDELFGGAGRDDLIGGGGNDVLAGGGGTVTDRFIFAPNEGSDTIVDFVDGIDLIGVGGFGPLADSPGEVVNAATQVAGGTFVDLGSTEFLISGLSLADFDAGDVFIV